MGPVLGPVGLRVFCATISLDSLSSGLSVAGGSSSRIIGLDGLAVGSPPVVGSNVAVGSVSGFIVPQSRL